MEDGEERSEAQDSDSGFGEASKVEESFRSAQELDLKLGFPVRQLQVLFICSNMMQQLVYCLAYFTGICDYLLEFQLSCLVCDAGLNTKSR